MTTTDDVAAMARLGASEWTLTGTTTDGIRLEVRGCDLWTFRDGLVLRKDSYWKIVEPPPNAWAGPPYCDLVRAVTPTR